MPHGSSEPTRDAAVPLTVSAILSPSPALVGDLEPGLESTGSSLQLGKIAASASVNSTETARSSREEAGDVPTSRRSSFVIPSGAHPPTFLQPPQTGENERHSATITGGATDLDASSRDKVKGSSQGSSNPSSPIIGRRRLSPSDLPGEEGDDLDERDVLFACEDQANSSPVPNTSPSAVDGSSPARLSPFEDPRGMAIPESQINHRQWAEEDDEESECITGGVASTSTSCQPSSLRPDLAKRLNLNCRSSSASSRALSFSLSFVNHMGVRRKVGFLYNLEEDEPVHIANEMVEDLSLKEEEAQASSCALGIRSASVHTRTHACRTWPCH